MPVYRSDPSLDVSIWDESIASFDAFRNVRGGFLVFGERLPFDGKKRILSMPSFSSRKRETRANLPRRIVARLHEALARTSSWTEIASNSPNTIQTLSASLSTIDRIARRWISCSVRLFFSYGDVVRAPGGSKRSNEIVAEGSLISFDRHVLLVVEIQGRRSFPFERWIENGGTMSFFFSYES